ncbi:MAG: glycerol dehydrogenase [Bacteroidota bacterium]
MKPFLFQSAIFPARYIQGRGAIKVLPEWIGKLGTRAMIIAGGTASREIIPHLKNMAGLEFLVEAFGGECTGKEINRITEVAKTGRCDVVVALGGGKVIDTVKAVANELNAKTIIVPTIASNDAPCSAISVVYTETGSFDHVIHLKQNPNLVLLDSEIIAKAPVRLLIAGMGDALSTWFEADACYNSGSPNEAEGRCTLSALKLARLCYDTILEFGVPAVESCRSKLVTPELEKVIEANTLMSGLGFESAGLASAHSIHNGLTQLSQTHSFYHGEKVAFGVLAGLFLAKRPDSLINEVYAFCESVGLPVTLAQIGVINPSDEDLERVSVAACSPQETIWHEPSEISPELVAECIKMADARGKICKS